MSRQNAGLRKEHTLAQAVYETTGGSVIPLRAGWSGNSAVPAPDLLIPYRGSLRSIELKTSDQKRLVVSQEDVKDVVKWAMDMTEVPTYPYISIKFSRWEVQTFRIYKPWDIETSFEYIAESCDFDSRVTRTGNISFGHPTHYECAVESARSSPGDAVALLRDLKNDDSASHDDTDLNTVGVYEILSNMEREF